LELLEPRPELLARPRGEARADLACEPQAIPFVDSDDHGTQVLRIALAGRVPAYDELLLGPDLDLQPGRGAPARLVGRASQLRDDPLEATVLRGLVELEALFLDV
jgi:hypothetical protein